MTKKITEKPVPAGGIRFSITANGHEAARARLYVLCNDLHDAPEGYLVDLFVEPAHRGHGLATRLLRAVIEAAKRAGCYKIVATSRHSRPHVHAMYLKFGFTDHSEGFRLDL